MRRLPCSRWLAISMGAAVCVAACMPRPWWHDDDDDDDGTCPECTLDGGSGGAGADLGPTWLTGDGPLQYGWHQAIYCMGSGGPSVFANVGVDPSDNAVLGGWIDGDCVVFGDGLESTEGLDVLVASLAFADGQRLWGGVYGDSAGQRAWSAAASPFGLVIAGTMRGHLGLSGVVLDHSGAGYPDGAPFVAQYGWSGMATWGRLFHPEPDGIVLPWVVANAAGQVLYGSSRGSYDDLGGEPVDGGPGGFVLARFDRNGVHEWSRGYYAEFPNRATISVVGLDDQGNAVIAGKIVGELNLPGKTLYAYGYTDEFWAKLAPDGSYVHGKVLFDSELTGVGLAESGDGNTVISGSVGWDGGMVNFGDGSVGTDHGEASVMGWYGPDGTVRVSRAFPGSGPLRVAHAADGGLYLAAHFHETVGLGDRTLTSVGGSDVFVAKLEASGEVSWAQRCGNEYDQALDDMAVASDGSVYLLGRGLAPDGAAEFSRESALGVMKLAAP